MGLPARTEPAAPARQYRIKEGDTLWSIASDQYGDGKLHEKVAAFNKDRLTKGGQLREGATLLLPDRAVLTGDRRAQAASPTPEPAVRPSKTATKKGSYTVKPGDTLGAIAKRELGSAGRWEEIMDLNSAQLDDETDLKIGMVLKLPSA
jgi:nucleoid-associated protein YgaU